MNTPKTIALLGGTFDPIHNGHLIPAKHVAQWLGLEQIRLMPAHIPPHKSLVTASAAQRVDMVKLASESEPLFMCDERELNRSEHSYTVDTLNEIKNEQPNSVLFFIIGMDSLLTFTQWKNWQEILTLCHLVVNCRPNYPLENLNDETQSLIKNYGVITQSQSLDINDLKFISNPKKNCAGQIYFAPEIAFDISSLIFAASTDSMSLNND